MKYKAGDKVILTNGDIMTVEQINDISKWYLMREDPLNCYTDEMIEGLVEEETNDCEKCGLTRNSIRCLFMDNCPHNKQKNIIEIPKDYVIKDENGNVINAQKIVLEKKKKEYPKTYEECCKVLGVDPDNFLSIRNLYQDDGEEETTDYERDLLGKFDSLWELKICRDAYWKIAGEEMGLGKPWEPDWTKADERKYCIVNTEGNITKWVQKTTNKILAFPTEEMRDAFYENFDPNIEFCKEFL